MEDEIEKLLEQLKLLIDKCEEIKGQWDGDNSGYLEDLAREAEEVQTLLQRAQLALSNACSYVDLLN